MSKTKKGSKTAAPTLYSNDYCYRMLFKFTGRTNKLMVMLETTRRGVIMLLEYNGYFTVSSPSLIYVTSK